MSTILDLRDAEWAAFVASRPEAGPFHHPSWAQLIADSYNFEAFAYVLRNPDGVVVGGLPIIELGRRGRRRWVSLPFADSVPPLGSGQELERLTGALGEEFGLERPSLRRSASRPARREQAHQWLPARAATRCPASGAVQALSPFAGPATNSARRARRRACSRRNRSARPRRGVLPAAPLNSAKAGCADSATHLLREALGGDHRGRSRLGARGRGR